MIGLTGSQRTGKTTLAKKFAEANKIEFVETPTSHVMKQFGMDPAKDYPIRDRLSMQWVILGELRKAYENAPMNSIADRTPIDTAAYLLADVQRQNVPEDLQGEMMQYVEECFRLANRHFSFLVIIQPGIALANEPGKAPASVAHIEHMTQLIVGLCNDQRLSARHFYIARRVIDLDTRVSAVGQALRRFEQRMMVEKEAFESNGFKLH